MADNFQFIDSDQANTAALIRARVLASGASGSGKTFSGLKVMTAFAELLEPAYGFRPTIWGLDTERESMLLYKHDFKFKHLPFNPPHSVARYLDVFGVLRRIVRPGDIFLYDSLTHAWAGPGGILERVDIEAKKFSGNKWAAWGVLTPLQNKLIDELLALPLHLWATTRSKTEWLEAEKNGKKTYAKIGTQSVQREGMEYEFTIGLDFDMQHAARVGKTRVSSIADQEFAMPGHDLARALASFVLTGKGDATDEEFKSATERIRAAGGLAKDAKFSDDPPRREEPPPPSSPPPAQTSAEQDRKEGDEMPPALESQQTPASKQTVETSAKTDPTHAEKLTREIMDCKTLDDLRKMPAKVRDAVEKKLINREQFDELTKLYGMYKRQFEKKAQEATK